MAIVLALVAVSLGLVTVALAMLTVISSRPPRRGTFRP